MVQWLLRTPAFHRGVEKVARGVHRLRHGIPPEERGGTKIDAPTKDTFLRHFSGEIQTQLGRAEAKTGQTATNSEEAWARAQGRRGPEWAAKEAGDETADAAWKAAQQQAAQPPKQGFMGEYMGALREQLKNGR
jgi:hypothetical protein